MDILVSILPQVCLIIKENMLFQVRMIQLRRPCLNFDPKIILGGFCETPHTKFKTNEQTSAYLVFMEIVLSVCLLFRKKRKKDFFQKENKKNIFISDSYSVLSLCHRQRKVGDYECQSKFFSYFPSFYYYYLDSQVFSELLGQ